MTTKSRISSIPKLYKYIRERDILQDFIKSDVLILYNDRRQSEKGSIFL